MIRRRFLSGAAGAGVAAAAAFRGGTLVEAAGHTTRKRDLIILQPDDVTGFDPQGAMFTGECAVLSNIYDTLVRRRPDGSLEAALATSWKRTTATTWELDLRQGVPWHDGTRFTSRDAKYSLDRTYDPTVKGARLRPTFLTIDRTDAPAPHTLLIHTKRPDPLMPARLAYGGPMVPWAYMDRVGYTVFDRQPIGTGPLRLISSSPRDRCVLGAHAQYWDGRLDIDRVVVRPVSDPAERVAALLRGDADLIARVPPSQVERVAASPSTQVVGTPYAGLYVLLVNVWVPPLNDPLVRQALSLAIDRGAIVKDLWRGRGLVPSGPIPAGDDYFDPGLPPIPYDPAGARDRLRRAGYRREPVVLETTRGLLANDQPMADAIAEMWEDVGVNVNLEVITTEGRARRYRQQSFKGLTWSDPTSIFRHPEGMMGRLLAPGQAQDYWRHPEFDRLARVAQSSADETIQAASYRQMASIALEENPWIVVLQPYEDYGVQRYMEFAPSADLRLELRPYNFRMRRP